MKKVRRKILALSAAGVLAAGLAAGAATASAEDVAPLNHTNVSVDDDTSQGTVPTNGDNITDIWFNTDWNASLHCEESEITGNIFRGEEVSVGKPIGEITSMLFDECTATALEFDVQVTMDAGTFVVRKHPDSAHDPVEVTIEGVSAHMFDGSGFCELWADGTVDAIVHPGPAGSYDATVELVPGTATSGFDLEITTPNGDPTCGNQVDEGDIAGPWQDPVSGDPSIFGLTTTGPDAGVITHQ